MKKTYTLYLKEDAYDDLDWYLRGSNHELICANGLKEWFEVPEDVKKLRMTLTTDVRNTEHILPIKIRLYSAYCLDTRFLTRKGRSVLQFLYSDAERILDEFVGCESGTVGVYFEYDV